MSQVIYILILTKATLPTGKSTKKGNEWCLMEGGTNPTSIKSVPELFLQKKQTDTGCFLKKYKKLTRPSSKKVVFPRELCIFKFAQI